MSKPPRPDSEPARLPSSSRAFNALVKDGVGTFFNAPSAGKVARGRILPCFDFDVPVNDPGFKTSFIPYRDAADIREDEHAAWNQWYFPFEMYNFYGPNKRSFFSPRVRARLQQAETAAEAFDPISKLSYLVAKDPKWTHLGHLAAPTYNAPPGTPPSPLCRSRTMALMNFYGTHGDREEQNFVVMIPEGGMAFILQQLNKFGKKSAAVRDQAWPDYMFGDVTHPRTGLLAWSELKPIAGSKDKSSNTLTFSKNDDSAADSVVVPVTDEVLARRLNFFDTETQIHIPTPQEVLNWIIEDGMVPLEFIKQALGSYLDVPESAPARRQEAPVQQRTEQPAQKAPVEDDDDDDIPFHHNSPLEVTKEEAPKNTALSSEDLAALTTATTVTPEQYADVLKQLQELNKAKG